MRGFPAFRGSAPPRRARGGGPSRPLITAASSSCKSGPCACLSRGTRIPILAERWQEFARTEGWTRVFHGRHQPSVRRTPIPTRRARRRHGGVWWISIRAEGIKDTTVLEVSSPGTCGGGAAGTVNAELLAGVRARMRPSSSRSEAGFGGRSERRRSRLRRPAGRRDRARRCRPSCTRVVCCYPDYETLVGVASEPSARRLGLTFSSPCG